VPQNVIGKKVTIKIQFDLSPLETVGKPIEIQL
jgi:hypothetical protein